MDDHEGLSTDELSADRLGNTAQDRSVFLSFYPMMVSQDLTLEA